MRRANRYSSIIERIFSSKYLPGMHAIEFEREEIVRFAAELGVDLPKNLGDVVYSFRCRAALPKGIRSTAGATEMWICRPLGAQFMRNGVIALFEFAESESGVGIVAEKHYKLVPPGEMSEADLEAYCGRTLD